MEKPESWDTQQHKTINRIEHLKSVLIESLSIMESQISDQTTTDNNEAVNQQNTPIW